MAHQEARGPTIVQERVSGVGLEEWGVVSQCSGKGAILSLWPCYVWEFRGFFVSLSLLSLCFVIIIKYSRAQREKIIIPLSSSLSVALGLNGYFE